MFIDPEYLIGTGRFKLSQTLDLTVNCFWLEKAKEEGLECFR